MRRLSSMKPDEKFIYQGKVCTRDEFNPPKNKRFPIVELETGKEFNPLGTVFVEEYKEEYPEPDFVEVVEEEKTPYTLDGYKPEQEEFPLDVEVEDDEDDTPF